MTVVVGVAWRWNKAVVVMKQVMKLLVVMALSSGVVLGGCSGSSGDDDSPAGDDDTTSPPGDDDASSPADDSPTPAGDDDDDSPTPAGDDDDDSPEESPTPGDDDSPTPGDDDDSSQPTPDPDAVVTLVGGEVSGRWCGRYDVTGSVTVAKGAELEVCAGSSLTFQSGVAVKVDGTLRLEGESGRKIVLNGASSTWSGLTVTGTLEARFIAVGRADTAIKGQAGSSIQVSDASFSSCTRALNLSNGGTFERIQVLGGSSVTLNGGALKMTDSVVDLYLPETGPDCVTFYGGSAVIDHSRFTGCHCSMHINQASGHVQVTNSILDGNVYPVMISGAAATFTGNNLINSSTDILDIGGGIQASVAGNYWGGGAPQISSSNLTQFTGAQSYASSPIPGAGPR